MAKRSLSLATTDADIAAARALCHEWLAWHWAHYPDDWPRGDDHPMNPESFETVVQDLPNLHARPHGGIILARIDDVPLGCVMYAQAAPQTAVFNRMFVSASGRGHGLGRALLDAMISQLVADGYARVFFSSATFLTHARAMYEAARFAPMSQPEGFPEDWRDKIYFMERSLP